MSDRRTFLGNAAAAAVMTNIPSLRSFGFTTRGPDTNDPTMSDREKAGLRGPVEQCFEETITPPSPDSPETRFASTIKYDLVGRRLHFSSTLTNGSKAMASYTYDSRGHLLKTTSSEPSGPVIETNYTNTYDEQGRLIGITGDGEQSSAFQYDDQGRKTRVARSELKPSPSGTDPRPAMMISIENDDLSWPPPVGGHVKTFFDERDQPTETQVYVANGHLTNRLVRRYDAMGRVAESYFVVENIIESIVPAEDLEQLMADPAAMEEMNKQITQFRSLLGMARYSYIYDAEDRIAEKHVRFGTSPEMVTKFTYNDHGDKIEEHMTTFADLSPTKSEEGSESSSTVPAFPWPQESNSRYSYQYDSFGNWTKQTGSYLSRTDDLFKISAVRHQTITYY
jgi:YD repeat-containing protein